MHQNRHACFPLCKPTQPRWHMAVWESNRMQLIFQSYQISNNFLSTWASSLNLKASFNLMKILTWPVFSFQNCETWRIVVHWQKPEAGRHTLSGLHELQPTALRMDWMVVASYVTGLLYRLVIHDRWEKSRFSSSVCVITAPHSDGLFLVCVRVYPPVESTQHILQHVMETRSCDLMEPVT